jgi:hypothetical protein
MSVQNIPVYDLPYLQANGCVVSFASTTTLGITTGQVRDSTDTIDLVVGDALVVNSAVNGANGLDTGTFAKASWYYTYIIGDSRGYMPVAGMISLSASAPTMPFGYDSFRLIDANKTASGSAVFASFINMGTSNTRTKYLDVAVAVVSGGTQTGSFAALDCSAALPPFTNVECMAKVSFTAATAGDFVEFRPTGSSATTGTTQYVLSGIVAAQPQIAQMNLLSGLASGLAKIDYENSAASGATTVAIGAFKLYI